MSSYIPSQRADRELIAAWSRAEKAELAVLKLQRENATLRAELKRKRDKATDTRSEFDKALDQLQGSAGRQEQSK